MVFWGIQVKRRIDYLNEEKKEGIYMRKEILCILKCQQCLGKLNFEKENLVCNNCKTLYPIWKGLVFMGYDKNKKSEIEKIISTERDHQTNLDEIQKHYDFSYPSFKIGLLSTMILKHDIKVSKLTLSPKTGPNLMCKTV